MTNQHPITPPPELVLQLLSQFHNGETLEVTWATAFQAGADQELEACCEWVRSMFGGHPTWADELRAARRPKPPSVKEQALALLDPANTYGSTTREEEYRISIANAETIRRALESIND